MRSYSLLATLALALIGLCAGVSAGFAAPKCPGLRALNGECANPLVVGDAESRAMTVSTARLSYFGTPMGDIGGPFIPFNKQFQDSPSRLNEITNGLPTYSYLNPALYFLFGPTTVVGGVVVNRTK